MKHDTVMCWNLVVKKKQGTNVSKVRLNEGKKEAEIAGNEEDGSLGAAEEKWQKALNEWDNYKRNNKKEKGHTLLDLHSVELPGETEKENTQKRKVLKM